MTTTITPPPPPPPTPRIISLDQFRGYTVMGMFLVNFVGSFQACQYILKHHNTFCSYADTIMPQFLFAVGFAFRLTFGRRLQTAGAAAAYWRVVRRLLGLILVALVVYSVDRQARSWEQLRELGIWGAIKSPLKREWFQTLMHIAVTSFWILPVIRSSARVRIAFMLGSAALHVLLSYWFYFLWVNGQYDGINGIDGGNLGFLTWSIPAIIGTLTCDVIAERPTGARLALLTFWSILLMVLGYLFSCGTRLYDVPADQVEARASEQFAKHPVFPSHEALGNARHKLAAREWSELAAEPPFIPPPHPDGKIDDSYLNRKWNYWMMSQRAGTISYLTFSAGFSLFVYVLFYIACDKLGLQLGVFRTFGMNALAAYVLHGMVAHSVKAFMPRDVPAWYMWAGCALFMLIVYLLIRGLEKNNIFIKV